MCFDFASLHATMTTTVSWVLPGMASWRNETVIGAEHRPINGSENIRDVKGPQAAAAKAAQEERGKEDKWADVDWGGG